MADHSEAPQGEPALHPVQLLGIPLDIARRSLEHTATLMRELALVDAADDSSTAHGRLLVLAAELREKYARFGAAQRARAQAAARAGEDSVDLSYEVPGDLYDDATRLAALMVEVDAFCRAGDLVTLVTPPDIAAYRRWVFTQFVSQLRDGAPATAWKALDERDADDGPASTTVTGRITVEDDLDLEGAARVRDDITEQLERGVTDLAIDLQSCEFVDSVGISLLLTTLGRLRDAGGSVTLVNASEAVRRTLRHAGILDLLVRD